MFVQAMEVQEGLLGQLGLIEVFLTVAIAVKVVPAAKRKTRKLTDPFA